MKRDLNRREFLQNTTVTGLFLATQGLHSIATAKAAPVPGMARILVLSQAVSTDTNPRSRSWVYIEEVLRQAGLFFETINPDDIEQLFQKPGAIVLLVGDLRLNTRQREALGAWVKAGGALLGIGGASGLSDVFGVSGEHPLSEGWMQVTASNHPLTSGLRSALHVFGGYGVQKTTATSLAELKGGSAAVKGSAILENPFGKGRAVLLAPDLLFSIVHIQQGIRVLQDGKAPADGSALVNEGVLKAEDGMVLDWQKDRKLAEPDQGRFFSSPSRTN